MGSLGSKQKGYSSKVNYHAAVQGLSGAGKSAICYRLRSGDYFPITEDFMKSMGDVLTPSLKSVTMQLVHRNRNHMHYTLTVHPAFNLSLTFNFVDFQEHVLTYGGRMPLFHLTNLKVKNTTYEFGLWEYILAAQQLSGIVFCVDSSDRSSIDEARVTLEVMLLRSDLKRLPLLVYANKQDLEGCMSPREVEDVLQLSNIKDRPYHVEGCSAASGEGLWEGLEWLAKQHHGGKKTEYVERPVNETLEDGKAMLKSGHSWISSLFVRKNVK